MLELIARKNRVLLDLERARSVRDGPLTRRLALEGAALEAAIAAEYVNQKRPADAAVNLISQASCLTDARNYEEAVGVLESVLQLPLPVETVSWVQDEIRRVRNVAPRRSIWKSALGAVRAGYRAARFQYATQVANSGPIDLERQAADFAITSAELDCPHCGQLASDTSSRCPRCRRRIR